MRVSLSEKLVLFNANFSCKQIESEKVNKRGIAWKPIATRTVQETRTSFHDQRCRIGQTLFLATFRETPLL